MAGALGFGGDPFAPGAIVRAEGAVRFCFSSEIWRQLPPTRPVTFGRRGGGVSVWRPVTEHLHWAGLTGHRRSRRPGGVYPGAG